MLTDNPDLRSDVGNRLAEESKAAGLAPMGVVCYEVEGKMKVSLRSVGDFDTTSISKRHSGGGHRNASSFMTPIESFNAMKE